MVKQLVQNGHQLSGMGTSCEQLEPVDQKEHCRQKASPGKGTPEGRMASPECDLQKPVGNVSWAPGDG